MEIFAVLLPEISVVLLGLALIIAKLLFKNVGFKGYGWMSVTWLSVTLALMIAFVPESTFSWGGLYFVDAFAHYFKMLLIVSAILVCLASISYVNKAGYYHAEYFALLIFALLGMMAFASAGDLITAYIGLELMTLSLVVLIAFARGNNLSTEASIKYLLLSALSSAVMLFGMSLIYGYTGTTIFAEMAPVAGFMVAEPLYVIGLIFLLAGFAFKISAVPFHMWAPDIYQGAPTPIAGFMAVGSKAASLALLSRLFLNIFADYSATWMPILVAMALLSMFFGNIAAIPQKDVKRMLAYSSIAQVGYLLLGIVAAIPLGTYALIFYVTAYTFANLGAFIVVGAVEEETGSTHMDAYPGLSRRAPFLAAAMFVFMVSLGGLPPMAGFVGKFFLFTSAIDAGFLWLAVIGLILSMISVYYYFTVVRMMYFTEEKDPSLPKFKLAGSHLLALVVCVTLTVILGIFFRPLSDLAMVAAASALFM